MVAALGARLKKELAEMKGTVEILEDNASEDFFTVL
jgi:hypothetical protein